MTSLNSGSRDFDFVLGSWTVHNRRLKKRLVESDEWEEFEATSEVQTILNGLGNLDRFIVTRDGKRFEGMTVRLFDPATGAWSIYWADTVRAGAFLPPMKGSFESGVGKFFGDEEVNGKTVLCRFLWKTDLEGLPRWEQAFSANNGKNWETNWIMTFKPEGKK